MVTSEIKTGIYLLQINTNYYLCHSLNNLVRITQLSLNLTAFCVFVVMRFNSTYTLNHNLFEHCCVQPIFKKYSFVFIYIVILSVAFYFFLQLHVFLQGHFPVSEELSLVFILGQFFWQRSISFYLTEHGFISPSFLKDKFSRHRILGWSMLFYSTSKVF